MSIIWWLWDKVAELSGKVDKFITTSFSEPTASVLGVIWAITQVYAAMLLVYFVGHLVLSALYLVFLLIKAVVLSYYHVWW